MKLVIDLPDEVVKWFKGKGFIPIGQYLTVDEAVKKAEPLSEVLAEIKGEISEIPKKYPMTKEYEYGLNEAMAIIDKHISGEEIKPND